MPTKNIDKALLDKLAKEAGKEMKKEEVAVKEGLDLKEFADAQLKVVRDIPEFAYSDSAGPIPGENITEQFEQLRDVDKDSAADRLIAQNALVKARNENAATLTPEERMLKRQQIVDQLMYQAEEAYFLEHRFVMDGRTKRRTRAMIERNYDKGRYRPRTSKSSLNG
jgi:hypothetical protein